MYSRNHNKQNMKKARRHRQAKVEKGKESETQRPFKKD